MIVPQFTLARDLAGLTVPAPGSIASAASAPSGGDRDDQADRGKNHEESHPEPWSVHNPFHVECATRREREENGVCTQQAQELWSVARAEWGEG